MSEFNREIRYVVVKVKDNSEEKIQSLLNFLALGEYKECPECVVVEHDWANYDDTWAAIEAVSKGDYAKISNNTEETDLRVKELEGKLKSIKDNYYLISKKPSVGVLMPFMCVPSVIENEYTASSFYHAWAKDWADNK